MFLFFRRSRNARPAPAPAWWLPALWLCLLIASPATAAYREGFDSPEPSWRLAGSDCGAQLVFRERTFQPAHVRSGAGAEYLRIAANQGSYIYATQHIGRARVIPELRPSLWIKSSRTGIQLRARAVLPRSRDPHTGGPVTLWVEGESYSQVGGWQQLRIANVALQVQRQARIRRAQHNSPDVDEREAYLDLVVLNAYGGPGETEVWIDDLEIDGYSDAGAAAPAESAGDGVWADDDPLAGAAAPGGDQPPRLEGTTLIAGRGPLAVRMIEYRGESLAWLKSLGFNAVRLPNPPTPQQLEEARRLDLWLVAPPPQAAGHTEIAPAHDRVLAWDLGAGLRQRDVEAARRLAQAVRAADWRRGRPVLAEPRENLWAYRRMADVLLLGEAPLGTTIGVAEYRERLPAEAGRGPRRAPVWAMIQTEPRREIAEQLAALAGGPFPAPVEAGQIRLLVLAALEAGATGFCFRSHSPLDGGDPASQLRAAALHAVNRELSLIEPWIAGPARLDVVETGLEGVRATLLSTDRSKLIVLVQHHHDEQFAAAPCPPRTVPLLISGAPPSWKAYRIGGDRLLPFAASQVGGGMQLAATDVGRCALLAVTDDALTVNFLARRQRQTLEPLARQRYEILSRELAAFEAALAQAPDLSSRTEVAERLAQTRAAQRQCQALLDASDPAGSLVMAEQGEQSLAHSRRLIWSSTADQFASRGASPFCSSFAALPLHWRVTQQLQTSSWGPNSLAGGDFESVEHLRSAGWTHERGAEERFRTSVELSPDRPRQGRYALHLRADEISGSWAAATPAEAPPIRLTSAGVPVSPGALVRIRGWVRVTGRGTGDAPVLRISDSVGGEATGEAFGPSDDWRPFTLYRMAPAGGAVSLTFELLAAGEAWIDGVSIDAAVLLPPASPQATLTTARGGYDSPDPGAH